MNKKYSCKLCDKEVKYAKLPIQCDECDEWFHGLCADLNQESWISLGDSEINWFCYECTNKFLPYWCLNEREFELCHCITDRDLKALSDKCMEFNEVTLNKDLLDYDDDEFTDSLNAPISTQYVSHDNLCDIRNNVNSGFSIIHFNARSLAKNIENIENMLQANGVKFSVIAISETWLTEKHDKEYYNMSGYDAFFTNRSNKKGGGTALYIRSDISHECLEEGTYVVSECFEVTTVKINIAKNNVIFVCCVYKPNTSIDYFMEKWQEYLDKFKSKTMYICGDFNIDLMKYTTHLETTKFLDMKYSLGYYPLIIKPTRICTRSTTLVDNIFTNDRSNEMKNYILIDDISDHLPVFSVSSTFKGPHIENTRVNKRRINEKTVKKA